MFFHTLIDILRNSILITGLVIVMMMMIEALNIESHGKFFSRLRKTRFGQVLFGATLGLIPGCIGGFATVSLYTHGLFSFGALVAMMIASSGDEAFMMLAMFPQKALILFGVVLYITNRYQAQQEMIEEEKLRSELQDWKFRSMTRNSELTFKSRQSQLEKQLKNMGDSTLLPSNEPLYKITIDK